MQEGRPSLTALWVATVRARHQLLDKPPVFDDPVALKIIGEPAASLLRAAPAASEDLMSRTMRAPVVARSRIAEDALHAAVQRGVSQYVVLGAGLDTFAYRNPYPPARLQVFEVDHPATQAWKRGLLEQARIELPASLHFVALDFETKALGDALGEARFDPARPTFYSWLGVTMYLEPGAVLATLEHIVSASAPGSEVVFDFVLKPSPLDLPKRTTLGALAFFFARLGEPWKASFDPRTLSETMRRMGYAEVRYLSREQMNAHCFKGRNDRLKIRSLRLGGMMLARV
jgi:methyltransferase (TIGR00027 family)